MASSNKKTRNSSVARGKRLVARPLPERKWLLRGTALAGGVLTAIFFLPSGEALAACVPGSGPIGTVTCTGTDPTNYSYGATTNPWSVTLLDGYNNQAPPGGIPFEIDANSLRGAFYANAGSVVNQNDLYTALYIYDITAPVTVQIDGASGSAAASITGYDGIDLYGEDGGVVTLLNNGHVAGWGGDGVYIDDLQSDVDNHSYGSMIGADNGLVYSDPIGIDLDNSGGLISGSDGNGVQASDVTGAGLPQDGAPLVDIYNGHGGVIAGDESGIFLGGVYGDTATGGRIDVSIDNSGADDGSYSGGLIASYDYDGIHVVGVHHGGSLYINNANTLGGGVDFSLLDPLVYDPEGITTDGSPYSLQGLFSDLADQGITAGIVGWGDGIEAEHISGMVGIDNTKGLIASFDEVGVDLSHIGNVEQDDGNGNTWDQSVWVGNDAGVIWGWYGGIETYKTYGNIDIDNRNGGAIVAIGDPLDFDFANAIDIEKAYASNKYYGSSDININNANGLIASLSGEGIHIAGVADHDFGGGHVYINNGEYDPSTDNFTDGGIISGFLSAIDVGPYWNYWSEEYEGYANSVNIGNGTGGAILGSGYASPIPFFDAAVIKVQSDPYTVQNEDGSVAYHNISIINNGLISPYWGGQQGIPFDFSEGIPAGLKVLPHLDISGLIDTDLNVGEIPSFSVDVAAIQQDFSNIGDYAFSGGQAGSLDALAGYSGVAQGQAIYTFRGYDDSFFTPASGPYNNGSTYLRNTGVLIGSINLDGETWQVDQYGCFLLDENDDPLPPQGNFVQNIGGTWAFVNQNDETGFPLDPIPYGFGGTSITGFGDNVLQNAGLIQNAFDADHGELASYFITSYDNPGSFTNGGYNDANNNFVNQTGIVSLVDGGAGDVAALLEDYDYYYTGSQAGFWGNPGYSYLAVDTHFAPDGSGGTSDVLYVEGTVSGSTGIIVHQTDKFQDPDAPIPAAGGGFIPVVYAYTDGNYVDANNPGNSCFGVLCKEGDTFFIAPQSEGYISVPVSGGGSVGGVQSGFKAWYLTEQPTEEIPDPVFSFVSADAPNAIQTAAITTGVQHIFYDASGLVEDHVYGTHFPTTGSGGADLPIEGAKGPGNRPALWVKASGNWYNTDTSVTQTVGGTPLSIDTGYDQNTYSLLGGADFSPNGPLGGFRLGVYGGYTNSSQDFDSYGTSADSDGGVVGVYAAYTAGGFYADAQVNADLLSVTYKSPALGAGVEAKADATSIGVLANTGYRFDQAWGFFEPIASLAYVNTSIDDINGGNATVSFDDGESFRGGIGGRVGTTFGTAGGTKTEVSLLAKVWDEFEGDNTTTITDSLGNSASYSDNVDGVFGELRATADIYSADRIWSGFLSGGAKFNGDFTSWDAKIGVRKAL